MNEIMAGASGSPSVPAPVVAVAPIVTSRRARAAALPADPAALARLAFPPAIFNPVEDIVIADPLLLFALNPLPRPHLLAGRLPHLLFVALNPFSFLPVWLSLFAYLFVTIDTFMLFPCSLYPFTLLFVTVDPFPFLPVTVNF
jgi:hypothetical protein